MRMKIIDAIRKSDDRTVANLIGAIVAMHGDGISAEDALRFEYNETLKALQSEVEVDYKQTNADKIRAMSDEELAKIILCPYDTAGKPIDIMPCVKDGNIQELVSPEDCKKCMLEWLQSEVEE